MEGSRDLCSASSVEMFTPSYMRRAGRKMFPRGPLCGSMTGARERSKFRGIYPRSNESGTQARILVRDARYPALNRDGYDKSDCFTCSVTSAITMSRLISQDRVTISVRPGVSHSIQEREVVCSKYASSAINPCFTISANPDLNSRGGRVERVSTSMTTAAG